MAWVSTVWEQRQLEAAAADPVAAAFEPAMACYPSQLDQPQELPPSLARIVRRPARPAPGHTAGIRASHNSDAHSSPGCCRHRAVARAQLGNPLQSGGSSGGPLAMSFPRVPFLRILSLNVTGLRNKDKRRCLFNLLERDKWDVVLLQETHHCSPEEGVAWGQTGPDGLRRSWRGPVFRCHFIAQSRDVAVVFRDSCSTQGITVRHSSGTG